MPFKSDAQRKFFNANRGKLEAQGVNVDEWNQASKGMSLPEHVGGKKRPGNAAFRPRSRANGSEFA